MRCRPKLFALVRAESGTVCHRGTSLAAIPPLLSENYNTAICHCKANPGHATRWVCDCLRTSTVSLSQGSWFSTRARNRLSARLCLIAGFRGGNFPGQEMDTKRRKGKWGRERGRKKGYKGDRVSYQNFFSHFHPWRQWQSYGVNEEVRFHLSAAPLIITVRMTQCYMNSKCHL